MHRWSWFLLSFNYQVLSYFLLLWSCLLMSSLFFQLTNEPHMSHGMVNFDYKVIKSWKIYDLAHLYCIVINVCYQHDLYAIVTTQPRQSVTFFFLSKHVYGLSWISSVCWPYSSSRNCTNIFTLIFNASWWKISTIILVKIHVLIIFLYYG